MPVGDTIPGRLSSEAFEESKKIYSEEFPEETISDEELPARALSTLRISALVTDSRVSEDTSHQLHVTKEEVRVLAYLHQTIHHKKRTPSVRETAKAASFRSSQSGMRIVNCFIERGWISRNDQGRLELAGCLVDCKTKFIPAESVRGQK